MDYLYRRYASPLREFCRARLNGNGSEAEDACHDALLKAYRALPQFRPGPLWPWLATIAAHVCIDIHRKSSRTVELDERAEMQPAEDPEEEVARRTRIRIARKAMAQLSERYLTLITLRDYDGWSYAQIARTHGTSVGAVDSALVRARRALKALVEKEARREGSWPLPALVLGVLGRRSRASLRAIVSAQYHPLHSLLARTGHMIAEVAVSAVVLAGPTAALSSSDEELHRPAEVGVIEPENGQARAGPSAGREVRRQVAGILPKGLREGAGGRRLFARAVRSTRAAAGNQTIRASIGGDPIFLGEVAGTGDIGRQTPDLLGDAGRDWKIL